MKVYVQKEDLLKGFEDVLKYGKAEDCGVHMVSAEAVIEYVKTLPSINERKLKRNFCEKIRIKQEQIQSAPKQDDRSEAQIEVLEELLQEMEEEL